MGSSSDHATGRNVKSETRAATLVSISTIFPARFSRTRLVFPPSFLWSYQHIAQSRLRGIERRIELSRTLTRMAAETTPQANGGAHEGDSVSKLAEGIKAVAIGELNLASCRLLGGA